MKQSRKPSVYILGASGFLGSQCGEYLHSRGYRVFTNKIDVTDFRQLRNGFGFFRPDVVINFAGVRAYPTIDWCEDHKEETIAVNVAGSINVMLATLGFGSYPIQISSGCVYSGGPDYAFTEEDEPNFKGSFYSRMRIVLQKSLAELPVLCARIRLPISCFYHPRNTLAKMASYKEVISIPNSVTLIEDLWPALERLIQTRPVGVLNLTNEGYVDHRTLLEAYKRFVEPSHIYKQITLEELESKLVKAKRSNCVLSTNKAKSLGVNMPRLDEERIKEIMEKYRESANL